MKNTFFNLSFTLLIILIALNLYFNILLSLSREFDYLFLFRYFIQHNYQNTNFLV